MPRILDAAPPRDWPCLWPPSVILLIVGIFIGPFWAVIGGVCLCWHMLRCRVLLYSTALLLETLLYGTVDILTVQMEFRRPDNDPNWAWAFFDPERYLAIVVLVLGGTCAELYLRGISKKHALPIIVWSLVTSAFCYLLWSGLEASLTF